MLLLGALGFFIYQSAVTTDALNNRIQSKEMVAQFLATEYADGFTNQKASEIFRQKPKEKILTNAMFVYNTPIGFTINSYSSKWDTEKLKLLYEELLKNKHGEEVRFLSEINNYAEADEYAAATHKNEKKEHTFGINFPSLPPTLLLNFSHITGVISLYDGDHNTTFRDSAKATLTRVKFGFALKNFEADLKVSNDLSSMVLDLRREAEGETDAEAFLKLKEMLYDEKITPFMTLDMAGVETGVEQAYRFSGTIDIGKVIKAGGAEGLPEGIADMINEGLKGCTGQLTVTLPASEVLSGNAEVTGGTATARLPLSFDGETAVELSTHYCADGNIEDEITSLQNLQRILYLACGAAAVLLILAILSSIRRRNKKRQETEAVETSRI